jgi:MFS family permease
MNIAPNVGPAAVYPPARIAWYTVLILTLLYVCSFADRTVLTMLVPAIEKDLGAGDFLMSLLLGPAFALFYTTLGIPAGWISDRHSRRVLVAVGAVLWGLATAASGLAATYKQMAIARLSIGVGEATLTPAAHSMIAEQFPPQRLSFALSVFMLGVTLGGGLALAASGVLLDAGGAIVNALPAVFGGFRPWQVVFFIVASPTLILTPLIFTISDVRKGAPSRLEATGRGWSFFQGHRTFLTTYFFAFGITSIAANALLAWIPTFMARHYHMPMGKVGIAYGTITFIATGTGQLLWSALVDRRYSVGTRDAHTRFHMCAWLVSAPATVYAFVFAGQDAFMILIGVFFLVTFPFQGFSNAGLQLVTPPEFRGRMSASFLAFLILIGMMIGPPAVGFLTSYVFHDPAKLGLSIALVVGTCAPIGMALLWLAGRQRLALEAQTIAAAPSPLAVPESV